MCYYHAHDVSLACNVLVFVLPLILFPNFALSESLLLPVKNGDIKEAILFGAGIGDQPLRKNIHKRDDSSSTNTAWFGPRLGRKKRSTSFNIDEITENSHESDLDYYLQFFKHYPKLVLLLNDDNGKEASSKSRYGRTNMWPEEEERIFQIKAPPFLPHLDRRSQIPMKPRLGRAGNIPENAIFKPRLGRDPNFNDVNEFSDSRNNIYDKDH